MCVIYTCLCLYNRHNARIFSHCCLFLPLLMVLCRNIFLPQSNGFSWRVESLLKFHLISFHCHGQHWACCPIFSTLGQPDFCLSHFFKTLQSTSLKLSIMCGSLFITTLPLLNKAQITPRQWGAVQLKSFIAPFVCGPLNVNGLLCLS